MAGVKATRPAQPSSSLRWTALRKLALVKAVQAGEIDAETIHAMYGVTGDELVTWADAFECAGLTGLMVTKRAAPRR